MATREEKQIRLELPSTSGVECEIRESLSRDEYILTFFQNERQLKSCSITQSKLNLDQMVDILSDAGVEFFSFSAIFDVADLLINTIKGMFLQLVVEAEDQIPVVEPSVVEDVETQPATTIVADEEEVSADTQVSVEPGKELLLKPGDKLLKKFEMPYSQAGYAGVYYCQDGKYAIVLFQDETPLIRKKLTKDSVNEDNIVAMISESGIDFLSFSAIYDSAELIQNIILHPEEYIEPEMADKTVPVKTDAEISSEEATEAISEVEAPEDEMAMVDLSALDVSEYTKAEDFDKFVVKVTDFVNEGQPLPIKELEIEKSGGVVCIILRQMDSWFIRFRRKDGSLSDTTEIKIDQDEIARLINQDIPQISFSYLYDASENVYNAIEQLSKRPMGDVILNVAVGHFLKVIEQYEADGDVKAAAQVTKVLLQRFRREKNTKGILQFGKKLLGYYEDQKKVTKAIKLRNTLTEELLEIDGGTALEFVLDSLDTLITQEKHLNAANLCGLLLDHFLISEVSVDNLQHTLMLGRKQVDFYKGARLPSVMEENALRYAHYTIQQLGILDEDDKMTVEQKESFQEDITYLLDQAFESQEERKVQFELLESLENTLKLLLESNDKKTYVKYVERLIVSLEAQDRKDKALEVAVESTKLLLDPDNFVKGCDYGNRAIKLFYELNRITEAVDFSLDVVRGLIDIKETNAARDYLKFVESLIEKAFEKEEKRVEKQLLLGDLFGKLGLKDQAKSYIQAALQTIGDARRREKIVLKHVDDLLESHALLSAQEMVNLELSRLLNAQKINDVIKFCQNFIEKLREHKQQNMVFDYMKYCASLMIQTNYTDYKVLLSFIHDLQPDAIDHAAFIQNQLIILQYNQKEYTRAIDGINRFIAYLLENTERFDLLEYYIQRTTDAYKEMGDPEGALEALISFQKRILEPSVELAQKITDLILKELEPKEEFKKAISIVSPMIDRQIELGKYQDAYIFSVQNARYYERLGDIGKVIQYLEKVRDRFLQSEQFEDADRMTDLILRFGRGHKKNKLAITAMKNYSGEALERGHTKTATKFALEMAKLLEEENQGEKAIEFLQMIFNTIYEKEQDKESALRIFERIMEIQATKDEFNKIAKKFLVPLLHKYPDVELLDTATEVLKPTFEESLTFSENIFDQMLNLSETSDEVAEAIVDFVNSAYDEDRGDEGDRIANKYAIKLLNMEKVDHASRLMAIVLESSTKPVSEVIPASFNFIKELINKSLLEGAREYADRIINMITSEKKFGRESRILAGKIAEKFAMYVATENPDLASEYAYQASNLYRSMNDFESVVSVYTNLAERARNPKHAIRAFKRGINICKKYKADTYEAKLLSHLTEYLVAANNVAAIASFQQTLEKFEELQDFDELFNVAYNLIETAIKKDNLKIAYTYVDYIARLSTMIDKREDIGGILVFLLRHAEEVKDKEHKELAQKYIDELEIKPKKYKKEYASLAKERLDHLGEAFVITEPDELEKEPEPVPELVKTEEIVMPPPEVPVVPPLQEMLDEKIDEEVVSVIKQFGQEIPEEPKIETVHPPREDVDSISEVIPSIDEIEVPTEAEPEILQPEVEVKQDVPPVVEEPIEIPSLKEQEVPQKPALTDDEITSLFSVRPSVPQEVPSSEAEIALESAPEPEEEIEKEVSEIIKDALSDEETESLFVPEVPIPPVEDEQILTAVREEEISEEDEWEVDSFGRLWKKGTMPPSTEELVEPTIEPEEPPSDLSDATPDLTPLERMLQIREDLKTAKEIPAEKPEETIVPLEEELKPADIFDMPQVEYQEAPPQEESEESQVKIPDLADLFSDALSELGSISGETGEPEKEKKKRK